MNEAARRTRRNTYLSIIAVLVLAGIFIVLRHHWPKVITNDDVSIVGAALTLAATISAVGAAYASRDAARDSNQALNLHFRPGDVHVGFDVRNPQKPPVPLPPVVDPSPLWMELAFQPPIQASTYELVWIDKDNKSSPPHPISLGTAPENAGTEADPVPLTGIEAHETRGNPGTDIRADFQVITLRCTDRHVGARWIAKLSVPPGEALGRRPMRFELEQ